MSRVTDGGPYAGSTDGTPDQSTTWTFDARGRLTERDTQGALTDVNPKGYRSHETFAPGCEAFQDRFPGIFDLPAKLAVRSTGRPIPVAAATSCGVACRWQHRCADGCGLVRETPPPDAPATPRSNGDFSAGPPAARPRDARRRRPRRMQRGARAARRAHAGAGRRMRRRPLAGVGPGGPLLAMTPLYDDSAKGRGRLHGARNPHRPRPPGRRGARHARRQERGVGPRPGFADQVVRELQRARGEAVTTRVPQYAFVYSNRVEIRAAKRGAGRAWIAPTISDPVLRTVRAKLGIAAVDVTTRSTLPSSLLSETTGKGIVFAPTGTGALTSSGRPSAVHLYISNDTVSDDHRERSLRVDIAADSGVVTLKRSW